MASIVSAQISPNARRNPRSLRVKADVECSGWVVMEISLTQFTVEVLADDTSHPV
jgi:hypothetical protein